MDFINKLDSNLNCCKGDISKNTYTNSQAREIGAINIFTLEVLYFPSISAASRYLKYGPGNICEAIKNKGTILKEWKVFYKESPITPEELKEILIKSPKGVDATNILPGKLKNLNRFLNVLLFIIFHGNYWDIM